MDYDGNAGLFSGPAPTKENLRPPLQPWAPGMKHSQPSATPSIALPFTFAPVPGHHAGATSAPQPVPPPAPSTSSGGGLSEAFAKLAMENGWGAEEIDEAIRGLQKVKVTAPARSEPAVPTAAAPKVSSEAAPMPATAAVAGAAANPFERTRTLPSTPVRKSSGDSNGSGHTTATHAQANSYNAFPANAAITAAANGFTRQSEAFAPSSAHVADRAPSSSGHPNVEREKHTAMGLQAIFAAANAIHAAGGPPPAPALGSAPPAAGPVEGGGSYDDAVNYAQHYGNRRVEDEPTASSSAGGFQSPGFHFETPAKVTFGQAPPSASHAPDPSVMASPSGGNSSSGSPAGVLRSRAEAAVARASAAATLAANAPSLEPPSPHQQPPQAQRGGGSGGGGFAVGVGSSSRHGHSLSSSSSSSTPGRARDKPHKGSHHHSSSSGNSSSRGTPVRARPKSPGMPTPPSTAAGAVGGERPPSFPGAGAPFEPSMHGSGPMGSFFSTSPVKSPPEPDRHPHDDNDESDLFASTPDFAGRRSGDFFPRSSSSVGRPPHSGSSAPYSAKSSVGRGGSMGRASSGISSGLCVNGGGTTHRSPASMSESGQHSFLSSSGLGLGIGGGLGGGYERGGSPWSVNEKSTDAMSTDASLSFNEADTSGTFAFGGAFGNNNNDNPNSSSRPTSRPLFASPISGGSATSSHSSGGRSSSRSPPDHTYAAASSSSFSSQQQMPPPPPVPFDSIFGAPNNSSSGNSGSGGVPAAMPPPPPCTLSGVGAATSGVASFTIGDATPPKGPRPAGKSGGRAAGNSRGVRRSPLPSSAAAAAAALAAAAGAGATTTTRAGGAGVGVGGSHPTTAPFAFTSAPSSSSSSTPSGGAAPMFVSPAAGGANYPAAVSPSPGANAAAASAATAVPQSPSRTGTSHSSSSSEPMSSSSASVDAVNYQFGGFAIGRADSRSGKKSPPSKKGSGKTRQGGTSHQGRSSSGSPRGGARGSASSSAHFTAQMPSAEVVLEQLGSPSERQQRLEKIKANERAQVAHRAEFVAATASSSSGSPGSAPSSSSSSASSVFSPASSANQAKAPPPFSFDFDAQPPKPPQAPFLVPEHQHQQGMHDNDDNDDNDDDDEDCEILDEEDDEKEVIEVDDDSSEDIESAEDSSSSESEFEDATATIQAAAAATAQQQEYQQASADAELAAATAASMRAANEAKARAAAEAAEAAVAAAVATAESEVEKARVLYASGRYVAAVGAYSRALAAAPVHTASTTTTSSGNHGGGVWAAGRVKALGNRAACYLMLGRAHPAAEDCRAVLAVAPDALKIRNRLGAALLKV